MNNKKNGFTLVELMVVLVILAILAAILVPSFIGYIDKARHGEYIVECRNCTTAATTLLTEAYLNNPVNPMPDKDKVTTLAEVDGTIDSLEISNSPIRVSHLTYSRDGVTVTFCASPSACMLHSVSYNFSEEPHGEEPPDSVPLILTDSGGNSHTIIPSVTWTELKEQITSSSSASIEPGTLLNDETGEYIYCWWGNAVISGHEGEDSLTLSELAAENPHILKIDPTTAHVLTDADITSSAWNTSPKKGDICYYSGKYYVAPNVISRWSFPPDSWLELK